MKYLVLLLFLLSLSACGSSSSTTSAGSGAYTISGTVTLAGGTTPLAGVSVKLTGISAGTVTTASDGTYSFTGLDNGTYTITPSLTGYTFTPATVSVNNAPVTQNFTATPATYTISGTITLNSAPLQGVTVALTGTSVPTATTDASGKYSFSVNNGTYTITPSLTGYTFTPTTLSPTVNDANVTGEDFTAAPASHTISGTITSGGSALSGVTVALTGTSPTSTTTDASGKYSFSVNNGSYTVTPTSTHYTFSPTSADVTISNADQAVPTFAASIIYKYYAYVTNALADSISAYSIDPATGILTEIAGSPFPSGTTGGNLNPYSVTVDPSGRYAYVINATDATISAFSIAPATGALTSVGTVATGFDPFSVTVDPSGKYVYVANYTDGTTNGEGSISAYTIGADGSLTVIGTTTADSLGVNTKSVTVDPTGKYVYVANAGLSLIHI